MEVSKMEEALHPPVVAEAEKIGSHMTSAAAFVEGGIQDACDDACSICLEEFCDSDPSTVTSCKHEFHLQCVLEWCQRSSQCPMCWQSISLKDQTSQELLEAVERERTLRFTPSRNARIFHHPTLGDFELQHVPIGTNDPELEERIIQHLAAAAAMGRTHHFARREGQRTRSSSQGRPQFLVFSTHPNNTPPGPVPSGSSTAHVGGENDAASSVLLNPSNEELPSVDTDRTPVLGPGSALFQSNHQGSPFNIRSSANVTTSPNRDRAGPSDLQSISETLKSRFNAMSMRYRDSISKSTRGWKERLFSRSSSGEDPGSASSVSRMPETPEIREDSTANRTGVVDRLDVHPVIEHSNTNEGDNHGESALNDSNISSSHAASLAPT